MYLISKLNQKSWTINNKRLLEILIFFSGFIFANFAHAADPLSKLKFPEDVLVSVFTDRVPDARHTLVIAPLTTPYTPLPGYDCSSYPGDL